MSSSSSKSKSKPKPSKSRPHHPSSSSSSASSHPLHEFEEIVFNSDFLDASYYENFIETCLTLLTSETHLEIPITRQDAEYDLNNYLIFFVKLVWGNFSIKVLVKKSDVYLIAFASNNCVWYFKDVSLSLVKQIFSSEEYKSFDIHQIGFPASYGHLERQANLITTNRMSLSLSFATFNSYICELCGLNKNDRKRDYLIARGFLFFIQMIPECIRLKKFQNKVSEISQLNDDGTFPTFDPTRFDVKCQNNWETMSERTLQMNNLTTNFDKPVVLGDGKGETIECGEHVKQLVHILKSKKLSPG
ncbi:unnamed protein product [Cuscuta epithymum]|uniref:rRNA N-glycosylase n=1 Tax=Cuscuta epithymum TaxID=186058 RepID=A0AAV0CI06_9ASTE|nr:unnamed protein product [Cuscuta epithymum]